MWIRAGFVLVEVMLAASLLLTGFGGLSFAFQQFGQYVDQLKAHIEQIEIASNQAQQAIANNDLSGLDCLPYSSSAQRCETEGGLYVWMPR